MTTLLTDKIVTARKNHHCDASVWLSECLVNFIDELSFSEKRSIVKANRNNCMIIKGDKYVYQTGIYEGKFYAFRAIPDIHEVCLKYNVYEV